MTKPIIGMNIDYDLLQRQAATLGNLLYDMPVPEAARKHVQGVWELLHALLDQQDQPGLTVEVVVEGGVIQHVQAPLGVTVNVRDYDTDEADPQELSQDEQGVPCFVSVWEGCA